MKVQEVEETFATVAHLTSHEGWVVWIRTMQNGLPTSGRGSLYALMHYTQEDTFYSLCGKPIPQWAQTTLKDSLISNICKTCHVKCSFFHKPRGKWATISLGQSQTIEYYLSTSLQSDHSILGQIQEHLSTYYATKWVGNQQEGTEFPLTSKGFNAARQWVEKET